MDDYREWEDREEEPCGFVFLPSYYDTLKDLRCPDRQAILEAMFQYAFRGKAPTLNPMRSAIFNAIKPVLDNSMKRYRASVRNGRKGGRPACQALSPMQEPDTDETEAVKRRMRYASDLVTRIISGD